MMWSVLRMARIVERWLSHSSIKGITSLLMLMFRVASRLRLRGRLTLYKVKMAIRNRTWRPRSRLAFQRCAGSSYRMKSSKGLTIARWPRRLTCIRIGLRQTIFYHHTIQAKRERKSALVASQKERVNPQVWSNRPSIEKSIVLRSLIKRSQDP